MTEIVRLKESGKTGHVECYDGDGIYIVNVEDGTQGWFNENELEFLNFVPYANENFAAIRKLIMEINNRVPNFECMDIDNENFIEYICTITGFSREKYLTIMKLEEEEE